MWFAGMTQFKAVYVFEYQNPRSLHAKEFIHLLPEGIDPATSKMSRTFYGFNGDTMEDVLQKLNESVQSISADA